MSAAMETLTTKRLVILVLGMVAVPSLLFGGYLALKESSKSEVSGSIQLGPSSDAPFAPNRCESGLLSEDAPRTAAQFHGVDLFNASRPERRVRLIDDPKKGTIVTLRAEGAAPVVVDRGGCEQFEVRLEETGAMILDHWGLEGAMKLSCGEIVAQVDFASCYDGT